MPEGNRVPAAVTVPEQAKLPLELVTVQPVEEPPAKFTSPVPEPAILTPPVETPPILIAPVVPASRLIAVAAVEIEMVGAVEVNVKAVELVVMVSMEATPVRAPPVVTFKPPVEVRAKVPEALPIAVLPVLAVFKFKVGAVMAAVPELKV